MSDTWTPRHPELVKRELELRKIRQLYRAVRKQRDLELHDLTAAPRRNRSVDSGARVRKLRSVYEWGHLSAER
jgi:hypothetical protein